MSYKLHISIQDQLAVECGPTLNSPVHDGTALKIRSRSVLSSAGPLVVRPSVVNDQQRKLPVCLTAQITGWVGGGGEPRIDLLADRDDCADAVLCDIDGAMMVELQLQCRFHAAMHEKLVTVDVTINSTTEPLVSHEITGELGRHEGTVELANAIDKLAERAVRPEDFHKLRDKTCGSIRNRVDRILNHLASENPLAKEHRDELVQDFYLKLLQRWDRGRQHDVTGFVHGIPTTLRNMLHDYGRRHKRGGNQRPEPLEHEAAGAATDELGGAHPDRSEPFHRAATEAWQQLRNRKNFQIWCNCLLVVSRSKEHDVEQRRAAIGADPSMPADRIGIAFSQHKQAALEAWAKQLLGRPAFGVMAREFVYDLMELDEQCRAARIPRFKKALEQYIIDRPALGAELFGDA